MATRLQAPATEPSFSMNAADPQADTLVALPGRHKAAAAAPIEAGQGTLLPGAKTRAVQSPSRQHTIAVCQEQRVEYETD